VKKSLKCLRKKVSRIQKNIFERRGSLDEGDDDSPYPLLKTPKFMMLEVPKVSD
jgi:hypothetical protein